MSNKNELTTVGGGFLALADFNMNYERNQPRNRRAWRAALTG